MKIIKWAIAIIAVASAVWGCTSAPKASAGPDELDLAIRDASDYLNDNIPAGNKIVILNIQSGNASLSDYIIDELIANAVNDRVFSVVDRAQLDAIRTEQDFQWSGEVDDNSALEIGKFFGAQTIVSGAIGPLGDRHRMTIRALNVQTAEVQGQYNRNISSSGTISALMKGGQKSSASSGGTASSSSSGGTGGSSSGGGRLLGALAQVLTQPAGPRNGTYTLMPRPQGRRDGVWGDIYVSRVEVDSEYITFFFENTPTGGRGSAGLGSGSWDRGQATLFDLDKPTVYQTNTGSTNAPNGNISLCVFPRINATRLKLETRSNMVITEIILGEPDE